MEGSLSRVLAESVPDAAPRYPPPACPEPLWPAVVSLLAAIGLQLTLSHRLAVGPVWLLPVLEAVLLVALLLVARPMIEGEHPVRRRVSLGVIALVSAANIASLILLTHLLLHHAVANGRALIISGMVIWLTNVLIFGLWYWELDRGGPGRRAGGRAGPPDFLFTQMGDGLPYADPSWTPAYIDYLSLALNTATAFSPTDVLPLSGMAKILTGLQSIVSLVTLGLVISRAVNILA